MRFAEALPRESSTNTRLTEMTAFKIIVKKDVNATSAPGFRLPARDAVGAEKDDRRHAEVQNDVHDRVGNACRQIRRRFVADDGIVDLMKGFALVFRFGQRFDDADARVIVAHLAHHAVDRRVQAGVEFDTLPCDKYGDDHEERHRDEKDEREHRIDCEGERDPADEQDRRAHADALHHADHIVYVVCIRGQAGNERRHRFRVRLAGGEGERFGKQVGADGARSYPARPWTPCGWR